MAKFKQLATPTARQNSFILALIFLIIIGIFSIQGVNGQVTKPGLPKEKQTILGLYVTAKEAYEKWINDQDNLKILDVRTPEEYIFIGHPAMAWNIPFLTLTMEWDSVKKHFSMKPNPDFIPRVKQIATTSETILVICRSGVRSAMAVNKLAEAGYANVYCITDGVEGDLVSDPESVFHGKRMKNGWKNSGAPWTYSIDPKLMLIPDIR